MNEECGYWRDVGTIKAYTAARQDVSGLRPRFSLVNHEWPIYTRSYRRRAVKLEGRAISDNNQAIVREASQTWRFAQPQAGK